MKILSKFVLISSHFRLSKKIRRVNILHHVKGNSPVELCDKQLFIIRLTMHQISATRNQNSTISDVNGLLSLLTVSACCSMMR